MSNQVESISCPNCGQEARLYNDGTEDCLYCGYYSTVHFIGNYRELEDLNEVRECNYLHPLKELPEQNFHL